MTAQFVLTVLLMTVVTYASRLLPFLLLKGKQIGGFTKEFIELVPVALLAALVIPELLMPNGTLQGLSNPYLWTGILTFVFAKWVPNLFLSVVFGMVVFWGLSSI
jgi:branched-subunit amino acid transport protein